jgi:hypothetical protein
MTDSTPACLIEHCVELTTIERILCLGWIISEVLFAYGFMQQG